MTQEKNQPESAATEPQEGGSFKQVVWRIESLIVLVLLVMIWVIVMQVIPLLQKSTRNAVRQQDTGLIEERLKQLYLTDQRLANPEELLDAAGHFQAAADVELRHYQQAVFGSEVASLVANQSYYVNQTSVTLKESALPDEDNLHIWAGYTCEADVLSAWQPSPDRQSYYGDLPVWLTGDGGDWGLYYCL